MVNAADELPDEMAISAITLAELSAGPHEVRRNEDAYDEHAERARRLDVLQRAENEFDPIPFDTEAARIYGRVCAAAWAAAPVNPTLIAITAAATMALSTRIDPPRDWNSGAHRGRLAGGDTA